MAILGEVFDTLGGLLAEGGPNDPTFQRMVSVYRDVTDALDCRSEYEAMLAGLVVISGQHAHGGARPQGSAGPGYA